MFAEDTEDHSGFRMQLAGPSLEAPFSIAILVCRQPENKRHLYASAAAAALYISVARVDRLW
jgi:hypothetical protein